MTKKFDKLYQNLGQIHQTLEKHQRKMQNESTSLKLICFVKSFCNLATGHSVNDSSKIQGYISRGYRMDHVLQCIKY